MAPSEQNVVRVRLRYPDLETFIERFAPNVTRGGIFLASREPRPVGSVLRFELHLREGGPVMSGEGRVSWVKEFNAAEPHRPYGMGVQFLNVDEGARSVLARLLERKASPRPAAALRPPPAALTEQDNRPTERQPVPRTTPGEGDVAIDDTGLQRALDRARALAGRTEDVEALLNADDGEPSTLSLALSDLPRVIRGRRITGSFPEDP